MKTRHIRPISSGLVTLLVVTLLLGAPPEGGSEQVVESAGETAGAFETDATTRGLAELLPLPKWARYIRTGWKIAKRVRTAYTNYNDCIARQAPPKWCAALTAFCDIRENEILSRYHRWVSPLKPFEAFKLDCGNGVCFQCCFVPGRGCHTSFEGFPVINCNERFYGPGTRPAGLTLLDPDAQPGDACLFTPQTCNHLPLCVSGPQASTTLLPPNPLTSPEGIARRGHTFARWSVQDWDRYLNEYSTREDPSAPGAGRSLGDLADFVTGRGCSGWRTKVLSEYPFDWTDELFAITGDDGQFVEAASHLNGVRQLGLMRVLAAIPNVSERLASTDSRLWTEDEKRAYLSQVGDPDEALLASMSRHALEVLKRNMAIQDYRLLAVPVEGEPPVSNLHNGCELGWPPEIALKFRRVGDRGVRVTVAVKDPGQDAPGGFDNPLTVDWGDGSVDHFELPHAQRTLNASHSYAIGGRYIAQVAMENDSGLRGLAAIAVRTKARGGVPAPAVPSISQVVYEDWTSFLGTLTGNAMPLFFALEAEDDAGESHLIGLSENPVAEFNRTIDYGDVVAHNEWRMPLRKLILRPRVGAGFVTGFREWYFTIPRLTFRVYSTGQNDFVSHSVRVVPEMLEVYQGGQSTPLPPEAIPLDANGNAKIPVLSPGPLWTDRVEIRLTEDMFAGFSLGPVKAKLRAGQTRSWIEMRPDSFVPAGTR